MLSNESELPEQLKSYEIRRFEEVTSKKKFDGKLVVLVNKNDIDSMVKFFYYEQRKTNSKYTIEEKNR